MSVSEPVSFTRAALVVNTHSRTGERAYAEAERILRDLGAPVETSYPLSDPSRLAETVSGAVDDGHDMIILGGGDGTVSSVVDVLAHRQVPMGLLPLGTANDFGRTLHVPTDLEQACRTLVEGKIVDIDLGLCGDNYYVNRASLGLGPLVAECLSPTLKKRTGPLAYPVATLRALRRHRPFAARLVFPDGEHEPQEFPSLLQVSVANGRYFGGGQLTVADSGIDDNALDISIIRHGTVRELVGVARHLKSGQLHESSAAEHYRATRVRVETTPSLPINVDGEVVARTPRDFSAERNALHVVVPSTWVDAQQPPE